MKGRGGVCGRRGTGAEVEEGMRKKNEDADADEKEKKERGRECEREREKKVINNHLNNK